MSRFIQNTTPFERNIKKCVFAENFRTQTDVEDNDGTVFGTPTINRGATLDGSTDYITYELRSGELRSATISFVIEFYPDFGTDEDEYRRLFSSGNAYYVQKRANADNNVLRIRLGDTTIGDIAENVYSPYWEVSGRNVLVLSATDGDTSVWLNGVKILDSDTTSWSPEIRSDLLIGAITEEFYGKVTLLRIFNYALDGAYAQLLYDDPNGSLIEEKIRSGELVGYWDFRSGSFRDWSGNGNDGVGVDVSFSGNGFFQSSGSGRVVVGDNTNLRITSGTLVYYGYLQKQVGDYLLVKRDAGGTSYQMAITPTQVYMYDGANARTINAAVSGEHLISIGVESGLASNFYLDGEYYGDLNGVNTFSGTDDSDLYISNYFGLNNPRVKQTYSAMIFNVKLTAIEHARLFRELYEQKWPTKKQTIANGIYHTDFGANETVTNQTSGQIENTDFQIQSGTWKISTDTIDGKFCKVMECVSSGIAYLPTSYFRQDNVDAAYGEWNLSINKSDASATRVLIAASTAGAFNASSQNGYMFELGGEEQIRLYRLSNGVATNLFSSDSGSINPGEWNNFGIHRSVIGEFTVYSNNELVSVVAGANPVTDNTNTSSEYMVLEFDSGDKIAYSSMDRNTNLSKSVL